MADTLPILIAGGLALFWVILIFYGVSALYKRSSPLHIIFWGTWICYALWYFGYVKENNMSRNNIVMGILIGALVLGAVFALFGSDEDRPN